MEKSGGKLKKINMHDKAGFPVTTSGLVFLETVKNILGLHHAGQGFLGSC